MRHKLLISILTGTILGLAALVMLTDPTNLSSIVLLVPFLLIFIVVWCTSFIALRSIGTSRARSLRVPFVFAGVPTGLLLLQSIGQLTIWDSIIVVLVAVIMYFYIAKMTAKVRD